MEHDVSNIDLKRIEIVLGRKDTGAVEVKFLDAIDKDALFAINSAYYLQAELSKGEVEHSH